MKWLTITFVFFCFCFQSHAQSTPPSALTPYFNALVVSHIDSSLVWYQKILGYEILNQKQFPEMGFKQANLSNGSANLELIELNSAISLQEVIPNYNAKTKVIGLFKLGFQVDQFDAWVEYLEDQQVQFNGRVVTNDLTSKRMVIILDPDGNRVQLFEK